MRSNLIWMQSLTSHMYALVTLAHMEKFPWWEAFIGEVFLKTHVNLYL